jgi:hypothetical protein
MPGSSSEAVREEVSDFDRGYEDGKNGSECRATSLLYLKGYRRGKEIASLRRRAPRIPTADSDCRT